MAVKLWLAYDDTRPFKGMEALGVYNDITLHTVRPVFREETRTWMSSGYSGGELSDDLAAKILGRELRVGECVELAVMEVKA